MERLTKRLSESEETYLSCEKCGKTGISECWTQENCTQTAVDRLAAIEDILGDDYDLDRLRELAQADREGRCVVLPCKIGDTVYSIRHEQVPDDDYRMSFHIEMRIVSQKFGLIHADCIGKSVFLTRAEAEAALKAREQE